jgi:holo-[acyl-carrier protein] synthase
MIAIGTDILEISRVEATLERNGERFMRRILCPAEQREFATAVQPARLLAKRFAAKEAIAKALGTGIGRGVSWQDMTVEHDGNGAPHVVLRGGALEVAEGLGGSRMLLSLADETGYVVAFAALVP